MELKNWKLSREDGGLAWLTLDVPGAAANTLSGEVMAELASLLDAFERQPPKALIIRSGKAAGFIAGADIGEFTQLDTPARARELVARGWNLFDRLAGVKYPTLALIRGHCMGGGLELALACRYRIAVDEPGTKLALPEVMLGIVPGWGGMKRLPEAIGAPLALDMMLTGRSVDARRARRIGLVDDAVPARVMDNAARIMATAAPPPRRLPLAQRLLAMRPLKTLVVDRAREQLARRARRDHYPAPYAILDIWADHGGDALAVPAAHPSSLDAIVASPTTRNLVRVFFLQERLKGYGKESAFVARRVHVVGAGTMGGDIAAWCAQRGLTVTLQDQNVERIAPAIGRVGDALRRRHRGDARKMREVLDRLIPDPQGHGIRHADVVIEAIFEDLGAKRALFARLEKEARPDALLATNTSSLRLEDIRAALAEPRRLVGIHFFNPVARMPLVEVVRGADTDPARARQALAFVRQLDKLPLPVASAPGFLVNAVLGPYMLEAMRCIDEGLKPEVIDRAAVNFGMPLGPVELADQVGLDIAMAAGRELTGAQEAPARLAKLVAEGHLGKKTGRGFYEWKDGKPRRARVERVPIGLAERLVGPLLTAAQACVERGVVADADLADAGVIFGTGFAPFTGGPLHYLKQRRPPVQAQEPAPPRLAEVE